MNLSYVLKTVLIANILSLLMVSLPSYAETEHTDRQGLPSSHLISLHHVVEETWKKNPKKEVLQARLAHLDAQQKSAESLWVKDPVLTINHYNDELTDGDGLQEWEVGVTLPLWLPGQKKAKYNILENARSELDSSEPVLKLEVAGVVREIIWAIAFAKNRTVIAEKEWQVIKRLESNVNKRLELGDVSQSDYLLAQQESLSKEAAYNFALQEYRHALHRYEMITGLEQLPAEFTETAINNYDITKHHPLLFQITRKVGLSEAELELSKKQNRDNPTLFIGTRHERANSNDSFANAIGLSFNMPFGLSSHTEQKVTAAVVKLSETRTVMELLYRQLNIAIQDASKELAATQQQLVFSERQTELSKKNLELTRKAFELGETSLIEFIRTQAKAFAVERNLYQKQLEVGLLTARLNQAKGIIP